MCVARRKGEGEKKGGSRLCGLTFLRWRMGIKKGLLHRISLVAEGRHYSLVEMLWLLLAVASFVMELGL